jgi:hypothetical protein
MFKYVPLLLLAGLAVAAPASKPTREGLTEHNGTGKLFVKKGHPYQGPDHVWVSARLRVDYRVAGVAGDTFTVDLWLIQTGAWWEPYLFDTQTVTIPGKEGGKLTEVKGRFDRQYYDRPETAIPEPGKISLPGLLKYPGFSCRLVVRKNGKVLGDTGYFKVPVPRTIEV